MAVPSAGGISNIFGPNYNGFQMGVNNGTISNLTFYGSAAQHQGDIRAGPFAKIPFSRDPEFIERGDILDKVAELTREPAGRAALVGLGGVGKSQLAVEYAYRLHEKSPEKYVFWIHAATSARFEESYREFARALGLLAPDDQGAQENVLELMLRWLENPEKGPWLMIVDNADDVDMFRPSEKAVPKAKSMHAYIPQVHHGQLLVTSRNREVASRLVGRSRNIIKIGPMNDAEGLALYKAKSTADDDDNDIAELLVELGYIPLAITQAASYIDRQEGLCSAKQYMQIYHRNEESRKTLLERSEDDPRRYNDTHNSIAGTWQISFRYIDHKRKSAADLLSIMSHFHWRAIPVFALRNASEIWLKTTEENIDSAFEADVAYLLGFSLVNNSSGNKVLEMHPLVQHLTRDWLWINARSERWESNFLDALDDCLAKDPWNMPWEHIEMLLPHLEIISTKKPIYVGQQLAWSRLLRTTASIANMKGQYSLAEALYRKALPILEKYMLEVHSSTLFALTGLGVALHNQDKDHSTVEDITHRIREACESLSKTKPDDMDTLGCWQGLYTLLMIRKEYELAEAPARWTLGLHRKVLGTNHGWTLGVAFDVAALASYQNRKEESAKLHRQVLQLREKNFGKEHVDTLSSVRCLGEVELHLGNLKSAEKLFRRSLEGRVKTLGEDHPVTLMTVLDVALVLQSQAKYPEAETMYRRAIEGRTTILGKDHNFTLIARESFADMLRDQKEFQAAEEIYAQVLEIREAVLGKDHTLTVDNAHNLALVKLQMDSLEKSQEAEVILRGALASREATGGENDEKTLATASLLAAALVYQEEYCEAEKYRRLIFERRLKKSGKNNLETLLAMNKLGVVLFHQEDYQATHKIFQEHWDRIHAMLGPQHPTTLYALHDLAAAKMHLGELDVAEEMLVQVLNGGLEAVDFRETNRCNFDNESTMAHLKWRQDDYEEANLYFARALDGCVRHYGADHSRTMQIKEDQRTMVLDWFRSKGPKMT